MNLIDQANYVCTQIGLTDTDDIAAAQLFLRSWDEQIYNSYLWKDTMIGVDYNFSPKNADNAEGVVIVPPVIDIVVAARVGAAPGVWGNSIRVHGIEDYYRVDWDWFNQQGTPFEFAELPPVWLVYRGAEPLQLINLNIQDSGAASEIIWYDQDGTKHVDQNVTPGAQFSEGGINQPPVALTAAVTTPTAPLANQDLIRYLDLGGNPPGYVPSYGVGICFGIGPLDGNSEWRYANGAWLQK